MPATNMHGLCSHFSGSKLAASSTYVLYLFDDYIFLPFRVNLELYKASDAMATPPVVSKQTSFLDRPNLLKPLGLFKRFLIIFPPSSSVFSVYSGRVKTNSR